MLYISILFFLLFPLLLLYHIVTAPPIASPELSLVIGAFLDPVDGIFKEPNPMLELGSLLPDHLVRRVLFQLLVADV